MCSSRICVGNVGPGYHEPSTRRRPISTQAYLEDPTDIFIEPIPTRFIANASLSDGEAERAKARLKQSVPTLYCPSKPMKANHAIGLRSSARQPPLSQDSRLSGIFILDGIDRMIRGRAQSVEINILSLTPRQAVPHHWGLVVSWHSCDHKTNL